MRTEAYLKVIGGLSFLCLGADASRPTKTVDFANNGTDCDPLTEQFMHIEGLDHHDHPKFTMRWRQVAGPCGEEMDESELASWEVFYDGSTDDAPDRPPTDGTEGRIKLNLFVCSSFGQYELDIDLQSFDDEGSTERKRIAFEIENGADEYHIWNTFFNELTDLEEYAPTAPGEYTWPLESDTGYYKTYIAGPLPPIECENSWPAGTEVVGCFENSSTDRLLGSDTLVLSVLGEDGMTAQICSDFCSGFDFFGLESGSDCYCGTADEFKNAVESDKCGKSYPTLCTGDATRACGGFGAISVYERTGDSDPAPAPVPAPTPAMTPDTTYSLMGCFADSKATRIMGNMMVGDVMSAEVCHELCDDGINTHFGTQFAEECWCAVDPDLTKNGEELELDECDMACVGTTSDEFCGGTDKITAYKIEDIVPEYIGCYADDSNARAMNMEGTNVSEDMTNETCVSFCAERGHAYAGTQYSEECWCGGESFDMHGEISEDMCSFPCEGDANEMCGGFFALSVFSTAA